MLELEGIDTAGWEKLGGTTAGGYYLAAPDVLVAVPHLGLVQTEALARASLAEFQRVVREYGRRMALIVLVDRVASQDAASRRVWSEGDDGGMRCALALVCRSLLARAIGSFFIGLRKSNTPTELFGDYASALIWAKETIGRNGGSL
jgi:hypothetical protein